MFQLELKKNTELTEKITYAIKEYRLQTEISFHKEEYEKRMPKEVAIDDGFFKKLKKNTGNAINKTEYERHLKLYNELTEKNNAYLEENKKYSEYNIDNIYELVLDLFKKDKYNVAKLEFAMNVVLDGDFKYECNDKTFVKISTVLGFDTNYLTNLRQKLQDAYAEIGLDKTQAIKNALKVGGIAFGVCMVASGIGALAALAAGATTAAFSLSAITISSLSLGISIGAIAGIATMDKNYEDLKKQFMNLTVEETAITLAKSIIMIKQLDLYKTEEEAKKLYDGMIEEYIDLKSDLDLRILVGKEDLENNNKKSEVFYNADKYLKKELNLI